MSDRGEDESTPLLASSEVRRWSSGIKLTNVRECFPYSRRIAYVGQAKPDGTRHGYGTLYHKETGATRYKGEMKDGLPHGDGSAYDKQGVLRYVGQCKHSKAHGRGTLYYSGGGPRYMGELKGGLAHGRGVLYDECGATLYEGEFIEGVRA